MKQYHDLCRTILETGFSRSDRTGTGTIGVFGAQAKYDLSEGFPLLTTKKMFTKGIIHELLWFLSGSTNIRYLQENGVKIWDEWADSQGNLGRAYGAQWRDWQGVRWTQQQPFGSVPTFVKVDQISDVVQRIKECPDDRRLIVTAWNPAEINQCALPPCHCFFQFSTHELTLDERCKLFSEGWDVESAKAAWTAAGNDDKQNHDILDEHCIPRRQLDLQLYQRSNDLFLGVPFNIASYALLLQMMAQVVGMKPGVFVHTYGDLHIYNNHLNQVREQLTREFRPLPKMMIDNRGQDIFGFKYEDFHLEGYDPHPAIKGEISI